MNNKPLFLVVDDDQDDRDLLGMAYNEGTYNCDLVFAESGQQALDILDKSAVQPSLLLLDINMPGMNGLELLQKLKVSERYRVMPIVILTTSSNSKTIDAAYHMGANSYLIKPDNFNKLSKVWDSLYHFWTSTAKLPISSTSFIAS
ncbi:MULTISPECIES: response regulator [unclassified Siphonobacter]|uniref:response regulator n=1 Tax=unclassified Siphonobacter TaxID=2635712 RepID=UPI0012FF388C|nr:MULTISPECIES: response regulator [unclassified Siphonobacter]MDQ1089220.1 CheY-like chemotaxis protein [Siphonobacter sp. SORGH_AS_1065]MDR6195393.1 CheY-like chemotaxis protein [Siphonobacter sp. SORGH_AS_0500]